MEENKMHSSVIENRIWLSPEDMPSSQKIARQSGETSTPNLSVWPMLSNLEFSAGSSKQDSGYYSHTPRSADSSGGVFDRKCNLCGKLINRSYVQSSPKITTCTCKNPICENQSPDFKFLQTISESNACKEPILSGIRVSRANDFYDEAMDTSLYPDEMEVDNNILGENHFSVGLTDIGEEKSIDFFESGIYSPPTTPSKTRKKETGKQTNVLKDKLETEESFSPEHGVLKCDVAWPEDKGSSLTKAKRSINFHTAAKKITVINKVLKSFTMTNIDHVDFFYQLSVRKNYLHITNKILSLLSPRDLDSVRVVSKTWNKVLNNDFPAYRRWKLFRTSFFEWKENTTPPKKTDGSGGRNRARSSPLSPRLSNISNQLFSTSRNDSPLQLSPPVSPKSARFRCFQKAAKLLKSEHERILQCPKCYFPSHDRGSPTAQCCRSGCRHRFCVWCRNEVSTDYSSHVCPPLYTPRPRRDAYKIPPIGSKKSKRNLRRL